MGESLWAISCSWGSVFTVSESRAHEVADTYDRCCGCRKGLGPGPGSHHIARGKGHPATTWHPVEDVPRIGGVQ